MIPVYIVTGFIGSGKSTFINEQLQYRKKLGGTACISAEQGSVSLIKDALYNLALINSVQSHLINLTPIVL